eukprot:1427258-Amphidinium_carterae.1
MPSVLLVSISVRVVWSHGCRSHVKAALKVPVPAGAAGDLSEPLHGLLPIALICGSLAAIPPIWQAGSSCCQCPKDTSEQRHSCSNLHCRLDRVAMNARLGGPADDLQTKYSLRVHF